MLTVGDIFGVPSGRLAIAGTDSQSARSATTISAAISCLPASAASPFSDAHRQHFYLYSDDPATALTDIG